MKKSVQRCNLKLFFIFLFLTAIAAVQAYSTGPDPGLTGAPAPPGSPLPEATCNQPACHDSFRPNQDNRGVLSISGLPDNYIPGQTYHLTYTFAHPSARRWGFEVTAIAQKTLNPAGDFIITDPTSTQEQDFLGRQYVSHYSDGAHDGTRFNMRGSASWNFDWRAPSPNVGDVAFYGVGNAANGNGAPDGDFIYAPAVLPQPRPVAVTKGQLNFSEVAGAAGIAADAGGSGVAWGDYNKDGALDLYIARAGQDLLYRNNGNGTFTEVAPAAGIRETATGQAAVWGDYDGDGDVDLFVANVDGPNFLYRNNGDGTFTEVGSMAGVAGDGKTPSRAAAWKDLNGDGHPDLFVVTDGRDRLYKNQGDETFTEVGMQVGITGEGVGHAVAIDDYSGDGKPDIFVANEGAYFLYLNKGDGSFTEMTAMAGIHAGGAVGRAAAWFDYNGDGKLDLVVVNDGSIFLYRNKGDGTFTDMASAAGLMSGVAGRGVAVADYDGDGKMDLFVANMGQSFLYRNNGNETFNQVAQFSGLTATANSQAAAWADYNKDGKPDLFVANADGRDFLYRNP
jgi:hypothetical protein